MTTSVRTADSIAQEISAYIRQRGGSYSQWYVGIATAPRNRLFGDHNVSESDGAWIYSGCATSAEARAIEAHFVSLGMKGGSGGGDGGTKAIYAYRITPTTIE